MKKRGNLYITLTPATFACFRTGIINAAKEVGDNDVKIKGDQGSIVVLNALSIEYLNVIGQTPSG